MSTQTKATAKNVNAKKELAVKATEPQKATPQPQKAEVKQEPLTEAKVLPIRTAEDRLRNLKNFNILNERHAYIKMKQDELNAFSISSDKSKEKISLSNQSGYSFEFNNSQLIEKIVGLLSEFISENLEETENQILEFKI